MALNTNAQITAKYSSNVISGCVPLSVNFNDLSTGSPVRWEWDLGNGNQSTLQNPSALFTTAGTYQISLKVWDASNNQSVVSSLSIKVFKLPVADFDVSVSTACALETINFSDKSAIGDATINNWSWDFGNGLVSNAKNPSMAYKSDGLFNVSIIIKDANGCESNKLKVDYIKIHPIPVPSFIAKPSYSCKAPVSVAFENKTNSSNLHTFDWDFGNGRNSTIENPSNTYNSYGNYTVSLTAKNSFGCLNKLTVVDAVKVQPIKANFKINNNNICIYEFLDIENLTNSDFSGNTYLWKFSDGTISTEKTPKKKFASSGSYTVKLIVKNGDCIDSLTYPLSISVFEKPTTQMYVNEKFSCTAPFGLTLLTSGSQLKKVEYYLDDQYINFQPNITLNYKLYEYKSYKVMTVSTDQKNCRDTIYETIEVDRPEVAIIPSDTGSCIPFKLDFDSKIISKYPIVSKEWTLDSNVFSTLDKPTRTYTEIGRRKVILKVKNSKGCESTDFIYVSSGNKVNPDFKFDTLITCNRNDVKVINLTKDINYSKISWKWDIGGDKEPIRDQFLYQFHTSPGKKDVKLFANLFGCKDSIVKRMYVEVLVPYVTISAINFDSCKTINELHLKANLTGAHRFNWQVGNKVFYDTSIILYPPFSSSIRLNGANDTNKCTDYEYFIFPSKERNVIAHIMTDGIEKCMPYKVDFTSVYNTKNSRSRWTLNGNIVSETNKYVHHFNKSGSYHLKLLEYDDEGCEDERDFYHNIEGSPIKANAITNSICLPMEITLTDSLYNSFNNYWIINQVDTIKSDQFSKKIIVRTLPDNNKGNVLVQFVTPAKNDCNEKLDFTFKTQGPTATILKSGNIQCEHQTVIYRANVESITNNNNFTLKWTFYDGSTSTDKEPVKLIAKGGSYKTILEVNDGLCTSIVVDESNYTGSYIKVDFDADPRGVFCPPLKTTFIDKSTSSRTNIISWDWDFGDGTFSKEQHPQKSYLRAGNFDVSLKITDNRGCETFLEKEGFILVEGPKGNFSFEKNKGCVPHTVSFMGAINNEVNIEWDLGDGNLKHDKNFTHTYVNAGRYIPSVILSDDKGCRYALPPIDTINVYNYPIAKFEAIGVCLDNFIELQNQSENPNIDTSCLYEWYDQKQQLFSTIHSPSSKFLSEGSQTVKLKVTNNGGCANAISKDVVVHKPNSKLFAEKNEICLGSSLVLENKSESKLPIKSTQWFINDSMFEFSLPKYHFNALKSGLYQFRLIVFDNEDCSDTMDKSLFITVGDTFPPSAIPIYRVSVENDYTVELKHSKNDILDFLKYEVYQQNGNKYQKVIESNKIDDTINFIKPLNTLRQSYCFKVNTRNFCLKALSIDSLKEHCSVEVKANPAINANILKWNAYKGWPVKQYDIYKEHLKEKNRYEYLATVDGNTLSYIDTTIICNVRNYYKILAKENGGYNEHSWSDTCAAQPIWQNTVNPNEIWRATVENDQSVLIEWIYPNYNKIPLKEVLLEKIDLNRNAKSIKVFNFADEPYLLDLNTKVHERNYIYRTKVVDICNDTSQYSNIGQNILLKTSFNENFQKPQLTWNRYQKWHEDVEYYVIERMNDIGIFEMIDRTVNNTDTIYVDHTAPISCHPNYVYRVMGVRNQPFKSDSSFYVTSLSNTSDAMPKSTLFMPNAFSPDQNNINELFGPKGQFIKRYDFSIFNRWGEKIFQTNQCLENWDGKFKGETCMEGVYLYVLEALGADNKHYQLKGTFTLLR